VSCLKQQQSSYLDLNEVPACTTVIYTWRMDLILYHLILYLIFSFFYSDLFVGQLKSKLTFYSCNHTSVTFDPFWDLSLPIPRVSKLRY